MPVIDGLDYADGANPLDLAGNETIQERLKAMNRQIDTDAEAYEQCKHYVEGNQGEPYAPSDQRAEIKALRKRAVMNLMPLAVSIPSQLSFADGYRRNGENFPQEWDCWQKSGFNSRQTSIWSAALTYGAAYVAIEDLGEGNPRLRLLSTRNTVAFWDDPVNDEHPQFAMTIRTRPRKGTPGQVVYYDAERIAYYAYTDGGDYVLDQDIPHDLGETPVRRFTCLLDDEGTSRGVVEMLIPAQDRVNQASFDLLATSTFSAFKVRWASGMMGDPVLDENGDPKVDADGNQIYKPIPVDQSTWVQTDDPGAKFGAIDETPLNGFQDSLEQGVRHFAVQGQLPPHALLGNMSNLSAETLVAAMSQTQRFAHILKTSWGQSIVALMRLVARDMGIENAEDNVDPNTGRTQEHYEAEVRWRDMADHTLASQVDALGKGVQMLNIPARALWPRFPGVTTGDIESWEELAEEQNAIDFNDGSAAGASAQREQAFEPPVGDGIPLGGGDR